MSLPSHADSPKGVVQRFYTAFADDDRAALNSLLDDDLRAYNPAARGGSDLAEHLAMIASWNSAYTTTFEIHEQIAEGEAVATRVTMHAIHDRGPHNGREPAGDILTIPAVSIERVRDGRIVERHVMSDGLGTPRRPASQTVR